MKYLGVDWGMRRVGLSISEGTLASPLQTLEIHGLKDGVEKVLRVATKEKADLIIIGKPEGEMGKAVLNVIKELQNREVEVVTSDETLSTQSAKLEMLTMGKGKKARREDNAMAAAIILQRYLDEKS